MKTLSERFWKKVKKSDDRWEWTAFKDVYCRAKLTEDAVRAIRSSAESQRAIAKRHGVDRITVRDVLRGKSWRHV